MKKINAYVSILAILLLTAHVIYEDIANVLFYYNPLVTKLSGYIAGGVILIHAILAIFNVYIAGDSKKIDYRMANIRTLLQRGTGILMLLLLPLHIFEFGIISHNAFNVIYVITEIGNTLFFISLFVHVAISFSKSLITLGVLTDDDKRKIIDIAMAIICTIIGIVTILITILVHIAMFNRGLVN